MKQTINFKFSLGEVVSEKITGFEGVIVSQCNYISGCIQYGVLSRRLTPEGQTQKWTYYDENRLMLTGEERTLLDVEPELPKNRIGGADRRINMNSSGPRIN